MNNRLEEKEKNEEMEVAKVTPKYVVKIHVSYKEAYFEFDTPEEACNFMTIAATSNVEGEDKVKVSMYVKREEEGDEE